MRLRVIRWLVLPVAWLPAPLREALAQGLATFFFSVVRFRRQVVLGNLTLAFGDELSPTEIVALGRENYLHYARTLFEILISLNWTKEDVLTKMDFHGWEHVQKVLDAGKGAFLMTSHLGNWEMALQSSSVFGMPVDVVVKRARTRFGHLFLEWYRQRFGCGILYEEGSVRDILRAVNQGRIVVFVIDQFMGPPIGVPVTFFGKTAGTAAGLALLSEKKEVPLLTSYNYRDNHNRLHSVIASVDPQPTYSDDKDTRLYQKSQHYNDVLENQIRQYPSQWLWLHRRWKAFRGESRWKPGVGMVLASLLLLVSCSSTSDVATPTGIGLPPDPTIAVPEFGKEDSTEETATAKKELPVVVKEAVPAKAKGKAVPPPVPAPAPTKPGFKIVPIDKVPFEVGEQLKIDLNWTALPAGRAILEVREGAVINGRPTFHLWGNVLSSKLVDTIYHVDNTIESYIDQSGFIPYKFLLSMFETAQKKETRVAFDHPNAKAYYWAKRISEKWGNQDIDRPDALVPGARDMFSALYYARALNWEMGKKQTFTIYENGQNWNVEATPVANELVTSGAGAFQCWKIKVEVKLNNVLSPTGDLYMWLSDDSKKYLVRFEAKIKIGSMYGNLTSVRERK